jgi:hypothetical protein
MECGFGNAGSAKHPTAMPVLPFRNSTFQKTLEPQFGQK